MLNEIAGRQRRDGKTYWVASRNWSLKVRFLGIVLIDLSALAMAAARRFWLGVMAGEEGALTVDCEAAAGVDDDSEVGGWLTSSPRKAGSMVTSTGGDTVEAWDWEGGGCTW